MSKIEVNQVDVQCGSTLTLGSSGKTVALACGASQTGFGRTGTVNWQTSIKTAASFSASDGEGYFVNTTSNAITANLPAGSVGAIVAFKDYAQNFDTNALTISANGSDKIEGQTFDLVLNEEGQAVTLVFGDATKGWQAVNSNEIANVQKFVSATGGTETTSGDFKIHTFTGDADFVVSCAGSAAGSNKVSYVVVAGGGGGGYDATGGGGAGGYREGKCSSDPYTASPIATTGLSVPVGTYPITIGSGGNGATSGPTRNTSGSDSVFHIFTSAGGGAGASSPGHASLTGGSGGGGGRGSNGAAGNTPPVNPPQGNAGGNSANPTNNSGGGGGATAAGGCGAANPNPTSVGGAGATTNIPGSPTSFAGGGGGAFYTPSCDPSKLAGGVGGGGNGARGNAAQATAGTTNTGGGGGGGSGTSPAAGGNGGSGIVVIRYKFQ